MSCFQQEKSPVPFDDGTGLFYFLVFMDILTFPLSTFFTEYYGFLGMGNPANGLQKNQSGCTTYSFASPMRIRG